MVLLIGVGAEEHHAEALQVLVGYLEAHDPGPEVPLGHQVVNVYSNVTQALYLRHAGHLPIALPLVLGGVVGWAGGCARPAHSRHRGVTVRVVARGPSP